MNGSSSEHQHPFAPSPPELPRGIVFLLLVFLALAVTYSVATPIFEASDELWHYPVVQYIATGQGLPAQAPPERAGLWKQQASQPPLYYALAALLTSWIDTRDLTAVLRPNPHAAVGVVTPDGNINMVAHDPAREAWPWRGTVLAVHLARLLSALMGTTTVYLTYRLGLEAFPGRADIALGAAAINAFTPMFTFLSGSVNNDNLVIPLCSLALLTMIRQSRRATDDERRLMLGWLTLGVVIGLATLAKLSGMVLLSLAALTGVIIAWKRRRWRHLFAAGLAIGLPVLALTGWWFWRNLRLYGDLTGMSMFTPYFTRPIPADLAQIWSERTSFLYGYWGNFGGLNLPIPGWAYVALNGVLLFAVVGLAIALIKSILAHLPAATAIRTPLTPQKTAGQAREIPKSETLAPALRFGASAGVRNPKFPLFLISLWGVVVFAGWLIWTRTTWSSQGRLVFYAIPSFSILIAAGLAAWLPRRIAPYALGGVGAAMALFSAAMPFTEIAPAYARPPRLTSAQMASISQRADVTFGDALTLLGYDVSTASIQPGDSITLTLYWQALKPLERNYGVFVHLLDENDIEAQDKGPAYPGRGNLPTTTLSPGQTWAEMWVVPVYAAAYAPARLIWELGLYDAVTGQRLAATDKTGRALGDNVRFGQVELARPSGRLFNPVSHNFGDQIELIGFDLDRRRAAPGETVKLTLFWRALAAQPARDYTVFAHVLQPPQTKWAGVDKQPTPSTSSWTLRADQIVSDTYPLTLDATTPPGVYEVEVGVYYFVGGANFERLKVITRDGRQPQDYILLSKVRVVK